MNPKKIQSLDRLFVLAALLMASCSGPNSPKTPEERLQELLNQRNALDAEIEQLRQKVGNSADSQKVLVKALAVQPRPFEVVTDLQGVVVSDEMVDLRPELGGRILRIHVKEGDEVQVGQKLVTLDGEQVRRAIEEAEKALELARTTYERQQALWDQKIGSEIQYLQAKNQKEQLELRLETLRNQLEKFVLTAPVRGTVDRLFMHVGDVAAPQAPILRIVNNSHVKVEADVPERYVGAFNKKSPVRLHFPAIGLSMEGIFRSIGQSIDPNNRTFLVVIEPQGPEKSRLLPNMLARVEVVLQARPQALVVPTQAIAFEDKGTYLWVCRQGKAFKVPVTVGATRGGESEIISGLQAGDLVVTEGYRNLRSGDPVQLVP